MISLMLAFAAQAAAKAPDPAVVRAPSRPVPVIAAPPAPPRITPYFPYDGSKIPPVQFEVEVSGGGKMLWSGSLNATTGYGARYSSNHTEVLPVACDAEKLYRLVAENSLNLSLRLVVPAGEKDKRRVFVDASWTRPSPNPTCAGTGRRTAQLQETADLNGAAVIEIAGDGDFKIRLTPR